MIFCRALPPVLLRILLTVCFAAWSCGVTPARAQPASSAATRPAAAGSFDIDLQAPDAVRAYIDRHLELKRYRELTDLDTGELARLMESAKANVTELLGTLGYFSADVQVTLREPRTVVIRVAPGEPTRISTVDIDFIGDIAPPASENPQAASAPVRESAAEDPKSSGFAQRRSVRIGWPLRRGDTFTQSGWDDAKSQSLRALTARKYPAGRIASSRADIDPEARSAAISLTLDSGPAYRLGPLRVSGSEHYGDDLVKRLARLQPGSDYDQAALLEAQQRLGDSGFFSSAFITLDTAGEPSAAPVLVQVRDAPLQKLVLGVGAGTDAGARFSVEHTHNLVPVIGWRAVSKLSVDRETQSIGTELTAQPDEDSWRWVTSALLQRQDAADVEVASQRLRWGRTQAGDRIDRNYYLQYDRARTTGVATDELAAALSVNYAWTLRRFDSLPFPTSGWGLGLEVGGGITLGTDRQPFTRTLARWQAYYPLGTGESGLPRVRAGRLATRLEGGAVLARPQAVLPSTQLFLTGGDTTVRGYGLREIGSVQANGSVEPGRYLGVGSIEYQRPIVWDGRLTEWENTVFIDAGAVADRPGDLRAKVGVGTGVRWKSPVGPLQIDVAYGVATRKLRLHLNVGFTF